MPMANVNIYIYFEPPALLTLQPASVYISGLISVSNLVSKPLSLFIYLI